MKTPPTPHAPASNRLFALDLLRTLACFLVIWQHVIEPYYAYPDLTIVRNADTPIVGWINSLTPIEVPLFVMISGYFLLPLREKTSTFFRRRFTRVLFPFVCWVHRLCHLLHVPAGRYVAGMSAEHLSHSGQFRYRNRTPLVRLHASRPLPAGSRPFPMAPAM